ncbi:MAG: TlpA family protein disulfide reductase [Gammaproteobacteria bacterium]|nr:TlpA family protein disulfide reductase [Gammaproteobacteria bacterium]
MATALVALAGASALAAPPKLDSAAPDFALKGIDGRNLRLSEYRGEPVILHFWASWCGPCRESAASLDRFGVETVTPVIGVNLDGTPDRASSVAQSLHLQSPTLVDSQQAVARTYDVAKLPLTLLIDADGTIRAAWSGVVPNLSELDPKLQRLRQD